MNDNQHRPDLTSPAARKARLATLASNLEHGADARAQVGQMLREIEALHPGSIEREAARLQLHRLGCGGLDLAVLDYPER